MSGAAGRGWSAAALLALGLGGCGLGGPAHGPPAANVEAVVDMGFESFSPATITIRPGGLVEWRNTSLITHTVTDDPRLAQKPQDAMLPAGAPAFNSGDVPAGQIYTRTFEVPGTYHYFCIHHEEDGMLGTVIVGSRS